MPIHTDPCQKANLFHSLGKSPCHPIEPIPAVPHLRIHLHVELPKDVSCPGGGGHHEDFSGRRKVLFFDFLLHLLAGNGLDY